MNPDVQTASPAPFPTRDILGVPVAAIEVDRFIDQVATAARERRRWRVCYVNAANFNLAARIEHFATVIRTADLVYADGQAVVWASHYLRRPLPERVNAGDFFIRFCLRCARDELKMYLLGSAEGVAEKAAENLTARVHGLQIVGVHHGHFDRSQSEVMVARISRTAPDVLVVGMGAPRQEIWVADHMPHLDVGVAWCVGALFEYFSETRRRAPVWMRKGGLEWLFRLGLEPGRLWRRYLLGNPQFVWRVFRAGRLMSRR